jgi:hypothetical protein
LAPYLKDIERLYTNILRHVSPILCTIRITQIQLVATYVDKKKVKVEFTLKQAMESQKGTRGVALPFNLGATWGVWSTPRPGRFTPGNDLVPIAQEAGWAPGPVWTGAENLDSTGIRSPDHPATSQHPIPFFNPNHTQAADNKESHTETQAFVFFFYRCGLNIVTWSLTIIKLFFWTSRYITSYPGIWLLASSIISQQPLQQLEF